MECQVITTQNFNEISVRLICTNGNDMDLWFTADEIGQSLNLEEPRIAINKLYQRHKDELEEFSMLWTIDTPGGPQEVRIFSEEAVYMITFFSQSKKAKEFRKWVAQLLKAYRQGKLGTGPAARDYMARMKEQRLFMREQRAFQNAAKTEAERILRNEGSLQELDQVPLLQEAVAEIIKNDPRSKQLGLFD